MVQWREGHLLGSRVQQGWAGHTWGPVACPGAAMLVQLTEHVC